MLPGVEEEDKRIVFGFEHKVAEGRVLHFTDCIDVVVYFTLLRLLILEIVLLAMKHQKEWDTEMCQLRT